MSSVVEETPVSEHRHTRIRTVRIDDFVFRDAHAAPDFAKIDTEGHAGKVLRGMERTLAQFRPDVLRFPGWNK